LKIGSGYATSDREKPGSEKIVLQKKAKAMSHINVMTIDESKVPQAFQKIEPKFDQGRDLKAALKSVKLLCACPLFR